MSWYKVLLNKVRPDGKIDFWRLSWFFLSVYAFSFALSIAATQSSLIPFIICVFIAIRRDNPERSILLSIKSKFENYPKLWYFYSPLILWVVVSIFSLMLGLDIRHSIISLFKFSIYLFLPLFVFLLLAREADGGVTKLKKLLLLFVFSHGIAGLHTFISSSLGYEIKPSVPGPLTESGQLELLFPLLFILPILFGKLGHVRSYLVGVIVLMCLWVSLVWLVPLKIALIVSLLVFGIAGSNSMKRYISREEILILICVSLSLSALILGLKRGPWFSILVELAILVVSFFGLRSLAGLILFVPLCFFSEVRERIFSFSDHFFIGGGRFDMWKLGLELIERFPMGLGFGNSDLIRIFDSTLPQMHRHMHNNFLNIFLESGLLGGLVLMIWIFRLVHLSWPVGSFLGAGTANIWRLLRGAIAVSVIGWQLGGLVEYNFGDGEIRLFTFVLLGIYLLVIDSSEESPKDLEG